MGDILKAQQQLSHLIIRSGCSGKKIVKVVKNNDKQALLLRLSNPDWVGWPHSIDDVPLLVEYVDN